VAVTNLLVYFNDQYVNIWQFDFTPREKIPEEEIDSLILQEQTEDLTNVDSSLVRTRTTTDVPPSDFDFGQEEYVDTLTGVEEDDIDLDSLFAAQEEEKEKEKEQGPQPGDPEYERWKSKTVKLYEKMDAEQVAKVIQEFSDNKARDIIYSMKKKKAAEVLSYLTPELVYRYSKAPQ
jgi:flagellar motility protein MotE (MotC chaperone)